MNEIKNKLLLAAYKIVPEKHLKQPDFTYSAFGPFTTNKERTHKKNKKTRDSRHIYQNK